LPGARREPIIPCGLSSEKKERINQFVHLLEKERPEIDKTLITEQEFWAAIERLRGTHAATMTDKRAFMKAVLDHLKSLGQIVTWRFTGTGERHDYEATLPDGRMSIIETKGCLDGNNTNIFERPPQADEFLIWSLCQNAGADPDKNAWSGIQTRLSAEIIHRQQKVDGVVIWDWLCAASRTCPKVTADPSRLTVVGTMNLPPPCLYLLPRTLPDPRNNPTPACWRLEEIGLMRALWEVFKGDGADAVQVFIEARMAGVNVQRRTRYVRGGIDLGASKWSTIKRARR